MTRFHKAKLGTVFEVKREFRSDNLSYKTVGEQYKTLGNISLKVEGYLIKAEKGWFFNGRFKPYHDYYNFDVDWLNRNPVRNIYTIGAKTDHGDGTPYLIRFTGDPIVYQDYLR